MYELISAFATHKFCSFSPQMLHPESQRSSTVFDILKFSFAVRLRGHKQEKLNDLAYSFMSSKPNYQAEI